MVSMRFLLLGFLVGCAVSPHQPVVEWATVGTSDSVGAVACTETISHPCPWLLYTHTVDVDDANLMLTWTDASGGTDLNGYPAAHRDPYTEPFTDMDGALVLPDHGDDGGYRHAATLLPTADGWEGNVVWSLFTVAGNTTFHVSIRR